MNFLAGDAACAKVRKRFQGARRSNMRMMMLVNCPIEPFNTLVRNGTAGATMKKILDDIKPEATYFAEPWFLNFNAEVEFRVCMVPQDLAQADLEGLGKKWG